MTPIDRKLAAPREEVARAIRQTSGCGYTLDGEGAFCDDPRLDATDRCAACDCRSAAQAALRTLNSHGFLSTQGVDACLVEDPMMFKGTKP